MTKREAIRECKRLWKEIEKSNKTKAVFFISPEGEEWRAKDYFYDCPLCEYGRGKSYLGRDCDKCPLVQQYKVDCFSLGFSNQLKSKPRFFKAVKGLKE